MSNDIKNKKYEHLSNNIRLGLCCINTELKKKRIFCSRTMIRKNFTVEKAQSYALDNINDIQKLILWNQENGIKHLRVSSDLFPHYTDPETEKYDMKFATDALKNAGDLANKLGHRITTHPGQYVQVGAKSESVFEKSVDDLKMHADFLDLMGIDNNGILCVHMGGMYGDKEKTKRRWIEQFDDLPRNVKNRLALENCEKGYSVRDCLDVATECDIPVIYDNHHHTCYCQLHPKEQIEPIETLLDEVVETWSGRNPLFHISEQAETKRVGAHSDYILNGIPNHMFQIVEDYDCMLDIEIEAKMKEQAILKLYDIYPWLKK